MLAPGFFGKVPARGDFISRRLPPAFRQSWETWLASLVVAARGALGEAWPEAWLTAPLWHFSLGATLAPPSGAVGVLVASVARVGRCFPFSIIAAADTSISTSLPDTRWFVSSFACQDTNAANNGNPTGNLARVLAASVSVPGAYVKPGAVLQCILTMGHTVP